MTEASVEVLRRIEELTRNNPALRRTRYIGQARLLGAAAISQAMAIGAYSEEGGFPPELELIVAPKRINDLLTARAGEVVDLADLVAIVAELGLELSLAVRKPD